MSSSSESGSEIDRPSKRRRIHSDTGDSDSMNEANGAKRTGIQTTMSGFLSGPGISSAVAAEVNAPSDAEKGRQKGHSSTPLLKFIALGTPSATTSATPLCVHLY